MTKESDFDAAMQAFREQSGPCVVLLVKEADDALSAEYGVRIISVIGYCPNQQVAKDYCDRENEIFKSSRGGVNSYLWEVLKELS